MCVLPDVKCAFLCGAERRGAGTDTAGHHLFPQVMDLCLETTILYTQRHTKRINIVRASRIQRTDVTFLLLTSSVLVLSTFPLKKQT